MLIYIVMNNWGYCAVDPCAMPEGWGALEQEENNYVGRFQCCNQFLMLPSDQLVQHTITCLIYPLEGYILPLCISTMPWRCRGDIEVKPCSLEFDIDWRFILWLFYTLGPSSWFLFYRRLSRSRTDMGMTGSRENPIPAGNQFRGCPVTVWTELSWLLYKSLILLIFHVLHVS